MSFYQMLYKCIMIQVYGFLHVLYDNFFTVDFTTF